MLYRTLGKTGLQVSILSYGAAPLGGVFGAIDEADALRSVHYAFDEGVNLVDVSPYYGKFQAEIVLGRALQGVARDRYLLSTKVGRYDANDFDFSADRVTRSVEESLKRLGVEHIDLLHCHDIEFVNLAQIVEETLPALRKLVTTGKVRFLSVSGLPLPIFPYVLERADLDAVLSYCHYTIQDTSLESLLPYLESKGVGVINASPLGMGLLTDAPPPAWHPAPEKLKAACARAAALCRERGVSIARLGLEFALANPAIATTLSGMSSTALVRENLAAVGAAPDPVLLADVQNVLAPVRNDTWPSGRVENNA